MGVLSIAFDTILVGAFALPWVLFAADLLFLQAPDDDRRIMYVLGFVTKEVEPAVAGVMLFALTYLLGSTISRTAQDFFNDDDLIHVSVTEDNIRTAEYCAPENSSIIPADLKIHCPSDTENEKHESRKQWICHQLFGRLCDEYREDLVSRTQQVFRIQEGALLLQGEDKAERLRHLHEQIMVLRGATFNGLLASVLCLFGWCAKKAPWKRWILASVPVLFFVLGVVSLYSHLHNKKLNDPPFMELTVILLGLTGGAALRKGENRRWYGHGLFLSLLLLTAVAYFGWWWTEVLYDRQVMYSFFALSHALPK